MSKKKALSIYPGPPLKEWMANRPTHRSMASLMQHGRDASPTISDTVAVNRLAERYQLALAQDFPLLHEATWIAAANALNGYTETSMRDVLTLDALVADDLCGGLEELPDTASVPEPIAELQPCSVTQRLAIVEVIERIWGRDREQPSVSLREAISLVSRRPPWSVYRGDPGPENFWQVERIPSSAQGERFRVTHTECEGVQVRIMWDERLQGYRIEDTETLDRADFPLSFRDPDEGSRITDDLFDAVNRFLRTQAQESRL
ncbi:hypothetical protein A6K26_009155 [Gammaproteobacteria bacterium 2W06]|nr:hypothetical protein A6K26_009155 [Gammaproteobacteria bacterium 2W06]